MHAPTLASAQVLRLVEHLAGRGLPARRMARQLGIGAELDEAEGRVALTAFYALLEEGADLLDDPYLGLHWIQGYELEHFALLGYLAMTAQTVRDAADEMLRFQRLWGDGDRFELVIGPREAELQFHPWGPTRPAHRHLADAALFDMARSIPILLAGGDTPIPHAELLTKPGWPERLALASPGPRPLLEATVPCRIDYGQPVSAVVWPIALLDQPLPGAHRLLHQAFASQAQQQVQALPASHDWSATLETLWRARMSDPDCTLEQLALPAIAQALGMAPRTLQRRLRAAGLNYRGLLDDLRRRLAEERLGQGAPVLSVALSLGYGDDTAFSRAFRRWTGRSPRAWLRARHDDS